MVYKVFCNGFDMLSNILKVRVTLPLFNRCFKHSPFGVNPLILSHCLEIVLFGDISRPLQAQLNLEIFAN